MEEDQVGTSQRSLVDVCSSISSSDRPPNLVAATSFLPIPSGAARHKTAAFARASFFLPCDAYQIPVFVHCQFLLLLSFVNVLFLSRLYALRNTQVANSNARRRAFVIAAQPNPTQRANDTYVHAACSSNHMLTTLMLSYHFYPLLKHLLICLVCVSHNRRCINRAHHLGNRG